MVGGGGQAGERDAMPSCECPPQPAMAERGERASSRSPETREKCGTSHRSAAQTWRRIRGTSPRQKPLPQVRGEGKRPGGRHPPQRHLHEVSSCPFRKRWITWFFGAAIEPLPLLMGNVTDVFQMSNTSLCGPFLEEDTLRKPERGDGQEQFRERVAR